MHIAVTGAFGYSGRYITRRLLDRGYQVITLTNSLGRPNPFGEQVQAYPFAFDEPDRMVRTLQGMDALINTYWVRFDHRFFNHRLAVIHTKRLFTAAREAGVRRIIHVSITNPDMTSVLPYFQGKAELESALTSLGVSYCILRPTVLFGKEDVLINNIAWALRRFPVFGVFGSGSYRLQPIYVDDLAVAAVRNVESDENQIINAIGPETFTYRGLVETIMRGLGLKRCIVSVPPEFGYWFCRMAGLLVRDIIITREEIQGLMEGRLFVKAPPLGETKLSDWIIRHRDTLGRHYTSEMARRLNRLAEYRSN